MFSPTKTFPSVAGTLGGLVWRGDGGLTAEPLPVLSSGLKTLDETLALGGVPLGAVTEIRARMGQGGLSLALSICRQAVCQKGVSGDPALCVVVDGSGTLHAPAVLQMGIPPGALWCARPLEPSRAALLGVRLTQSGIFKVVVVDHVMEGPLQPEVSVRRLSVAAQKSRCTVVLLSGPWADAVALPLPSALRLSLKRFQPTELEITVEKQRGSMQGARVKVPWPPVNDPSYALDHRTS
jgi:hypothetical protein